MSRYEHLPDFRVSYCLYSAEEGGRKTPHYQGVRWDFAYEDKSIGKTNQVFCIWPEFIMPTGAMLPDGEPMPKDGLANMFIVDPAFREFHCRHIRLGVRGYFNEGLQHVAVCEVVEVLKLHKNPKS